MSHLKRIVVLPRYLGMSGVLLLASVLLTAQNKQSGQSQSQKASDGAGAAKFIGVWTMSSLTPDGDVVAWKLTLKQADGKLAGTIDSDNGQEALKEITLTGTKIHFVSPYQGEDYDEDLDLQDGKLVGTWSGNGASGKTTGEHVAGS